MDASNTSNTNNSLGGHGKNSRKDKDLPIFRQRLAKRLKDIEISQRDLAKNLGLNFRTVFNYVGGPNHPDLTTLREIAKKTNTSLDWLFGLSDQPELKKAKFDQGEYAVLKTLSTFPPESTGQHWSLADHVTGEIAVHRSFAAAGEENCLVLNVEDDSMQPTIGAGSMCVIDTMKVKPVSGGVYAIPTGNILYLRRIVLNPGEQKVVLKADNANYEPTAVPLQKLTLLGRAVAVLGKL
jgi:transcriptional regulator with XRE-family HTH domain